MTEMKQKTCVAEAREALVERLCASRLAWGTHSDRWGDPAWQREFWGEVVDTIASPLAEHDRQVRADLEAAVLLGAEAVCTCHTGDHDHEDWCATPHVVEQVCHWREESGQ